VDIIGNESIYSWPDLLTTSVRDINKQPSYIRFAKKIKYINTMMDAEVKIRINDAKRIRRGWLRNSVSLKQKIDTFTRLLLKTDRFLAMIFAYNSDLKRDIFREQVNQLRTSLKGILFGA
jgi:hypothetical protein